MDVKFKEMLTLHHTIKRIAPEFDSPFDVFEHPQVSSLRISLGIKPTVDKDDYATSKDHLVKLVEGFYPQWVDARYPEQGAPELNTDQQVFGIATTLVRRTGIKADTANVIQRLLLLGERFDRWELENSEMASKEYWEAECDVAQAMGVGRWIFSKQHNNQILSPSL